MSKTILYAILNRKPLAFVGEAHNSHRGASQFWSYLWGKYMYPLPEDGPEPEYLRHPFFLDGQKPDVEEWRKSMSETHWFWTKIGVDKKLAKQVGQRFWDLWKDPRLQWWERVLLVSTFDRVMVMKSDIPPIIHSMQIYDQVNPGHSHFDEQIPILQKIFADKKMLGVCWHQTSVDADVWEVENDDTFRARLKKAGNILYGTETSNYHRFIYPNDVEKYEAYEPLKIWREILQIPEEL
jgi:hypothetical protein